MYMIHFLVMAISEIANQQILSGGGSCAALRGMRPRTIGAVSSLLPEFAGA
jgi:hypothetical protein